MESMTISEGLKTKIAEHLFFYHENRKAYKNPNYTILEPEVEEIREMVTDYDGYEKNQYSNDSLKIRIKDHLFYIDQELEIENDPNYRFLLNSSYSTHSY